MTYKYGQYAPDEHLQPYVRLWKPDGSVMADFPATETGWKDAETVTDLLNGHGILIAALKQWMCPACGGSRVYTGYSHNAPYGGPCKKCADTDGLNPVAFASIKKASGQ